MFSLMELVRTVLYLVVVGLVFWLLSWLVDYTAPPEPFRKIARVIIAVLAVLVAIGVLLSLVGYPVLRP